MSYNTRRGAGNFSKGIQSSQVGQRRSAGPNNYGHSLPPKNFPRNQQNENYGSFSQQQGSRQSRQPTAQQQLAQQQQMLVQKKQQMAQQQKQVQQKQNIFQQKQQEDLELKKKREMEEQKQKEAEKQKEMELQKQKDLELQKAKEIELQRLKEIELQRQKEQEVELQKQKEMELKRQQELEAQRLKQEELELQRIKQEQLDLIAKEDQQKQAQLAESQKGDETTQMEVTEVGSEITDQAPQPPIISEGGIGPKLFKRRFPQRNRKLSKYEIQRRRNLRLSKLLQPKSAMVILNEVGKNVTYNVEKSQTKSGPKGYMFKATVVVDDTTHEGYGLSKASAKNEAAEKALKFLVKNKKLIQTTTVEPNTTEGEEPMDTTEKVDKPIDIPLAWQQFASFAIYKLLDSWGEDLEVIKEDVKVDKKPAKKMPPNPELINPLMLMNQMLPRTNFVELPRTMNGPFSTFNFQAVVDGKTFTGSGISKKIAKRSVAFAICSEVLGIQYPAEIYTPPQNAPEVC